MPAITNLDVGAVTVQQAPNYWSKLSNWTVVGGNVTTLYFRLILDAHHGSDPCAQTAFYPATGTTVKVVFQRARTIKLGQTQTQQTLELTASQDSLDRSLFSVALTAANSELVTSGTVQFLVTTAGEIQTIVKNFFLKKVSTKAGC